MEGAETDEMALEEVWLHLLPLCRNLRSFFLNFEVQGQQYDRILQGNLCVWVCKRLAVLGSRVE